MMSKTDFKRIIILCLLVPAACELVTDQPGKAESLSEKGRDLTCVIEYINYGTSFGECLGYCVNQVVVKPAEVVMKRTGWNESGLLPEIKCSKSPGSGGIDELRAAINLDSFLLLDPVIGCPDCADGGAEWVEISFDTTQYRVTFEYMNEPRELEGIVTLMREILAGFADCE